MQQIAHQVNCFMRWFIVKRYNAVAICSVRSNP